MKKANKKPACRHDYKNAIKIGNIDYMCPLCNKMLDPMEWFFMNSFNFIDVDVIKENKKTTKNTQRLTNPKTGKKVITNKNAKKNTEYIEK